MALPPQLLDADELANLLKVQPRVVAELYRSGKIPVIRLSYKTLRFDAAAVMRALKQHGRSNGKQKPA
jgi:hypothetical protein